MKQKLKYDAVFIDLDDTIWDFHKNAYLSLQDVYTHYALSQYFKSFEHFFELYASRNKELWELYGNNKITKEFLRTERFQYPFRKVNVNVPESFSEEIGTAFLMGTAAKTNLIPYAKELLNYLYQKYPLSILSNGFTEVQYRKIRTTGIEKFFNHVVLSEEIGAHKPDNKIFEHALHLNQVTAEKTIMIGDNYNTDIIGAQNCGIDQIFFCPNDNANQPYNATFCVKTLQEVTKIL